MGKGLGGATARTDDPNWNTLYLPYHAMLSNNRWGKGGGGTIFVVIAFVCSEALLLREWLHICLPMGSSE